MKGPSVQHIKSLSLVLGILLAAVLGSCTEVHVTVDSCPTGMGSRVDGEPGGVGYCAPGASAAGKPATGFYGVGGTNPVPATPARTCSSGTLCGSPGTACDPLYPTKKCKNTYWYSSRACACTCQY
jgi:hypothetical protein